MRYQNLLLGLYCILTIIMAPAVCPALASDDILFARYPALSPDGNTIAFSYLGDIWTVPSSGGEARRLTVHPAEDILPQYSPDGHWILFSSRRYNNYDLYIIPVEGGAARQITTHTADDMACGWFPKGDSVIFSSAREGWQDLYKVSIDGGTPVRLTGYAYEREYNGRLSPDGRYLFFNNGSGQTRWMRRDLKTGGNVDIFIQDRSRTPFTSRRLTDYENHDLWPILNPTREEVYFVSCRGDWGQVWKMPLAGGEAVALTNFTGDGVIWLNANPQGTLLVFEQGFKIWFLDPTTGAPRPVPITIRSDEKQNLIEEKTFSGEIEWFSLSPDQKKIAAVIQGEIYVLPAKKPQEGIRITTTPAREQTPLWGSDSKTIYYSSDRSGNDDIYAADVTTGKETRLTESPENEVKPVVSPDGARLAFYRGLDKIIRLDLADKKETVWVTGMFLDLGTYPVIEYDWSSDSKWLTFTMAGPTYETDVFAAAIDGQPINLSRASEGNSRPRFSADGKTVYYTLSVKDYKETRKVDLIPKPAEYFEAVFDSLFADSAAADKGKTKDTAAAKKAPTVVIDTNQIELRQAKAYELPVASEMPVLTPDGAKYVFVASVMGKPDIWTITTGDDPEMKQITKNGRAKSCLTVTSDSKEVLYIDNGQVNRATLADGAITALSFKAMMAIDARELNRQKFNEAWQMLNTYFYDSKFHGTDWKAMREKYLPALDYIRTDVEFSNLLLKLMGELRASHLDVYSRLPDPDANILVGETGIMLNNALLDTRDVFRIDYILPQSPAALAGLKAGEYIQAVNGTALTPDVELFRLLAGTTGHRVQLTVGDGPKGGSREVALKPVNRADIMDLVYDDWVATRRHLVDSLSNGRLTYIHIASMGDENLATFRRELVAHAEQKDGLIIDVRNNPGGAVAVDILGDLVQTPYLYRTFRDFPPTTETKMRSKSLEKPMALLINNFSGSNAEIFAEGFRRLKLGKIIGLPTGSSVIGTDAYTLIDGQRVRRPSMGAFTIEKQDIELQGRRPDIPVDFLPDDYISGRDPQLVRAVTELLQELK